jgi:hypothetical protein
MSYQLTGTVKTVMDLMTFDSGFSKREFVVTTQDGPYPQDIKFETVRDKIELCDQIQPGQEVTVHFDIRGNEWKGRYFVNLNAWRIEHGGAATADADTGRAAAAAESGAPDDDIPF